MKRIYLVLLTAGIGAVAAVLVLAPATRQTVFQVHAAEGAPAAITVDYPRDGSIFPPEITAPTFLWHDASKTANQWRIDIAFSDGTAPLHFVSRGEKLPIGEIDPRCVSNTNKPPELTPEMADAHSWAPDAISWEKIKRHSVSGPAEVIVTGVRQTDSAHILSRGQASLTTSKDTVGAPIFYRDVPLMPSATEQGLIKPLAQNAIPLIQWRLRSIDRLESRVVLEGIHTCANCHSFSADGKTLGMDMDGPNNDKGLYALVPVKPQMSIRNEDMVNWNPTEENQFASSRVAFMSQVSPDGKHVLTMLTGTDIAAVSSYYVANFFDYRFLQVFYPTRGVLAWYDRATGQRQPLPGADDPHYVQTGGVWSPDGKYIVFARAEARNPYPPGYQPAKFSNDPNELQIKFDLYRIPFNDGRGGKPEPIAGASANGMSNNFPKVSPDGRWIVFVKCNNGQLMRPDGQLYIIPAAGGEARRLNANMSPMNSWHSWSPNGRWLVFSSKSRGPYTKMYLTHIDEQGNDSPAILIDKATAANRAVNIPEFVNIPPDGMVKISTPAVEMYKQFDHATELSNTGQKAEALAAWKALAAEHPDDARVQGSLGAELERMGDFQGAVEHYEKALELNPIYKNVHAALAAALLKVGRIDEAQSQFEIALQIYPTWPNLHNSYGNILARKGRLDEAIAQFDMAIERKPEYAEPYNNKGIALARLGRGDDAMAQFNKAIELNPRYADAHNNLGIALLSNSHETQTARAEQEFKTAIELNPRYADAENNLGTLYRRQGNNAEAERLFRQAVESNPGFIKAWINLGDELTSESRFSEAGLAIDKALQIDPANPDALSLREQLKAHRNP
ncbi:MAG: tetratricopeptide repeat protein [Terracidiphilus sp.]|jgi:Flp pilus assembly protein TadD